MELQHNGKVNIAVGLAELLHWVVIEMAYYCCKDYKPYTYLKASREEQSKIKDIGGLCRGYINGGKRKVTNILYRQLLTLDIDFGHKDLWLDFTVLFNAAVLHAHKSTNPRYRTCYAA